VSPAPGGGGGGGKRKADEDLQSGAAAKKANTQEGKDKEEVKDKADPLNNMATVLDEAAEAKAMSTNFKYLGFSTYPCTDVPFLQYDKDGPRRSGPLIQHLQRLMARHGGHVNSMQNLAIDLLSLACEQVSRRPSLCMRACVVLPAVLGAVSGGFFSCACPIPRLWPTGSVGRGTQGQ